MRVLLVLVVILLMAFAGWIRFSNSPQESTISIDKETIKQDTESVVDRARQAVGGNASEPTAPQPVAPVEEANQPTAAPAGAIR